MRPPVNPKVTPTVLGPLAGTNSKSACLTHDRNGQIISNDSGSTMKYFLSVTLFALAPSLFAQTLSQPLFRVDVDNGWTYSIEKRPQSRDGWGDLVSIHHPSQTGVLKILSCSVPNPVDPTRLREMTNVDWSEQLDWESWGDFSGYQYSYSEKGLFYRQWLLTGERQS